MTAYLVIQGLSVAAVVFTAFLAVRRYKVETDAATNAALTGMDATAAAAIEQVKHLLAPDALSPVAPVALDESPRPPSPMATAS